jgi:hypothetical protein
MMFTGNSVRSEGLIAENVELSMNIIDMDLTKEVLKASCTRHDDGINLLTNPYEEYPAMPHRDGAL